MPETPARLAERLREEGDKTLAFFRSLSPQQLEQQLYAEGSCWTVRQVLAHFVTAEAGFLNLFENILAGGPGAAQDFNIDMYNEEQVAALNQAALPELIEQFSRQRQASIDFVLRLQPADLARQGRHPFLGIAPLEDMVKLLYRHNQIHQRDVRKLPAVET